MANNINQNIVKTRVPRITPSSIGDLECPSKFKRLRVDCDWPARDFMENVAHGVAVHWTMQQLYRARRGGDLNLETLEALARDAVKRGRYPAEVDRAKAVDKVITDVCAFVSADDYEDVLGTLAGEIPGEFEYRENGIPLYLVSATLDRVLVRESEPTRLIVREYKTGKPKIDLRISFIVLWVSKKMFPGYAEYALEIDSFDEEHRVTREIVEGKMLNGQHTIITDLARKVFSDGELGHWPAIPGSACCYCPSRAICQGLEAEDFQEGQEIF